LEKTFLDFFAGIGGFRRGMEMAGHKCLGHCEWDKFANLSYKVIHEPREDEWFGEDIRRVRADELPKSDVWCFGFPCQDISVAGKQLGFNGNRSSLFFTVTRLIRDTEEENRPSTLFIENVKNLLSVNGGVDFLKLLIELDEIGYDAEWQVLNSKYYGVPHNRERVFIIGHLRERSRREIFPITGTGQPVGVPINRIAHANKFRRYFQTYDVNSSIESLDTCQGGGRQPCVKVLGNVNPSGNGMNGQVYDSEGIAPTLTTNKGEGTKILIRENTKKGYVEAYEGDGIRLDHIGGTTGRARVQPQISNTLTTGSHAGVIEKGFRIRKLTPKECFRLQGWNDEDFEKAASVCSDSQLYKQAGNGVTVNVIYKIAKRL
jgi:DNA (cytosine-5)-methyltransferase 1